VDETRYDYDQETEEATDFNDDEFDLGEVVAELTKKVALAVRQTVLFPGLKETVRRRGSRYLWPPPGGAPPMLKNPAHIPQAG